MGNAYTFSVIDQYGLVSAADEARITTCAQYVISLVSHYLDWQGTLDFVVDIRPASQSPYPSIDGILPSVAQIGWNGSAFDNQTVLECLTGTDSNPSLPDAGCTIYLAADGTIRNYGSAVWFDPNPQFEVDPAVPAGMHDFVGIYTHEIFHSLGFYPGTVQWDSKLTSSGGLSYFMGAKAMALFGGGVPFEMSSGHYGYTANPSIPISRGLMFQYGNYERNRFDIGRIDLAILADMGHKVKTYDGLSLFEMVDTSLNLSGTTGDDNVYGDYHANVLTGLGGNDLLDGGAGADTLNGGAGNDTYIVGVGDIIVEGVGGGTDTVYSAVNFALAAGVEVEILSVNDGAATVAINLTGNEFGQSIFGNAGANFLIAGGGADALYGGLGNDTYSVDTLDVVFDSGGNDIIYSSTNYQLNAGSEIETLSANDVNSTAPLNLAGNEFGQSIFGNAGNNFLIAGGGADGLYGGLGNDTYSVDTLDIVVDTGGFDTIYSSTNFQLNAGAEIEILSANDFSLTTPLNLAGNELGQQIFGNAGDNFLIAGAGADGLYGKGGNDTYSIDSQDVVVENAGEGYDTVYTSTSFILTAGNEVEVISVNDYAATSAINLTGNASQQQIFGNAGANILNGGAGADALVGNAGADTFAFTTALGGTNIDSILDFATGTDKIALDHGIFGLAAGPLSAGAFVTGSAAGDADDRIVYNATTGQLFYDADGSGAGAAILFATLQGNPALGAGDFVVI